MQGACPPFIVYCQEQDCFGHPYRVAIFFGVACNAALRHMKSPTTGALDVTSYVVILSTS